MAYGDPLIIVDNDLFQNPPSTFVYTEDPEIDQKTELSEYKKVLDSMEMEDQMEAVGLEPPRLPQSKRFSFRLMRQAFAEIGRLVSAGDSPEKALRCVLGSLRETTKIVHIAANRRTR